MNERFVWQNAFRDILRVAPMPRCRTNGDLPSMSAGELKWRSITAARLSSAWRNVLIKPRQITRYDVDPTKSIPMSGHILPEGKYVLFITEAEEDRSVFLQPVKAECPTTIQSQHRYQIIRPSRPLRGTASIRSVFFTPEHHMIAVVSADCESLRDADEGELIRERSVYIIDKEAPAIQRFLGRTCYLSSYATAFQVKAAGAFWLGANMPGDDGNTCEMIASYPFEEEDVMNQRADRYEVDFSTRMLRSEQVFLSKHELLVFNTRQMRRFKINEPLVPGVARKISANTATKRKHKCADVPGAMPISSHVIWNSERQGQDGPLVISYGNCMDVIDSALSESNSYLKDDSIRHHQIPWRLLPSKSTSRRRLPVVCTQRVFRLTPTGIETCSVPLGYRGHIGHLRLEYDVSNSENILVAKVDTGNIPLDGVRDMSWDEISGHLCLTYAKKAATPLEGFLLLQF
ncbi:hypothetical protein HYDPIDRAFT_24006 [Hydnomerulius pinastri MD-312]|nr:hypothetical protein HYDPIDRAFT_24006 [Hydnomerulius pinastri MD-312]